MTANTTSRAYSEPGVHKLQVQIIGVGLTVIVAMVGFWLLHGRQLTTVAEVKTIVQETAPYVADRKAIEERLANSQRFNTEIKIALDNNTRAIGSLETTIAVLIERIGPSH